MSQTSSRPPWASSGAPRGPVKPAQAVQPGRSGMPLGVAELAGMSGKPPVLAVPAGRFAAETGMFPGEAGSYLELELL